MKPVEVAFAEWRRLDCAGDETCRLVYGSSGWMLMGHARFSDTHCPAALDYVVRCDKGWVTTSADISGLLGGETVGWHISRDTRGDWHMNDEICPGLSDCQDIDLGFSPATNLLPLRRLDPAPGMDTHVSAAWFHWPSARLERLDQTYTRREPRTVSYRSDGFAADLTVDDSGFVTHYPGFWEGEVRNAG